MSGVLSALAGQASSGGGGPTHCADVVFAPPEGTIPLNVMVSTSTVNAHIFYRKNQAPQHIGDSAVSPTVRIGSNSGTISVTSPVTTVIYAVAYEPTHLDSNITSGTYSPPGP